ncbi:MAG: type II secretion system F family protein [Rhodospirillales bacterium]|nr:MAG: type II secretion system F family protein [Rhodospirillales bacterium]
MIAEALAMFGIAVEDAITVMAALAAAVTVYAVWNALLWRDPVSARAARLHRRQTELHKSLLAPTRRTNRTDTAMGLTRTIAKRLNLFKSSTAGRAGELLTRAGYRSKDALTTYLVAKLVAPFVGGAGSFLLVDGLANLDLPPLVVNLAPMAGVLAGFYAPGIYLTNTIQKREQAVRKGIPDAMDLLVICAEAGLSLDAALKRVAREMSRAAPEVAEEFALTAIELGFLPDRRKALTNLAQRCQIEPVRSLINTLIQTERYGTPLAHALRVLAAEYRNERMMRAEEKAAKLPAVLTVPLILFIMPALLIVLIGPGILRVLDALTQM